VSDVEQSTGVKKISLDVRGTTLEASARANPFWTVEYVFSRDPLEPGSVAAADSECRLLLGLKGHQANVPAAGAG